MEISSRFPTFSSLLEAMYGPISSEPRKAFYKRAQKTMFSGKHSSNNFHKPPLFRLATLGYRLHSRNILSSWLQAAKHLDQDKNWMIGLYGRVTSPICGTGTIWLLDRIWDAKSHSSLSTIETGMEVIIKGFSPPLYLTVSATGRRLLP